MFDYQPRLSGELVELRPLRADDLAALYAVAADPLLWEQHPHPERCREDVFRDFFAGHLASGGALLALDRSSGAVIGTSRFHGHDPARGEVEIGWTFLARSHWGGAHNRDMKALMLGHAFRFVDTVVFLVHPANHRSRRAVEKLGALPAGERVDGNGDLSCAYAITRERWTPPRYDRIGHGYAATRREDPRLAARIHAALGGARTVVNVGAGAGSYEPRDRHVLAVEPSDVMAAQRPAGLAPAIRAGAGSLPLRDRSVDAAMAVITVHHWDGEQERGVRELRRVARGPVVIVTVDPDVSSRMWLVADYLPEVAELDRRTLPPVEALAAWLGGTTRVETVEVPRETPDWTLASFWAHPERVLDPGARAATSGLARLPGEVVARAVAAVERDLRTGAWDARHGRLRQLEAFDAGLRLVVGLPG